MALLLKKDPLDVRVHAKNQLHRYLVEKSQFFRVTFEMSCTHVLSFIYRTVGT